MFVAVQTQKKKVCFLNTNRMFSSSEDWRAVCTEPAAGLSDNTVRSLV